MSGPTIGLVANVYCEANALPGWLEAHTPFFDDIRVLHAGPRGALSTDGTLEILSKWRIPVEYCPIDDGFGAVRTRALRMCPCDWVMLLDADERFFHVNRLLYCSGESTPQSEVDAILQSYDFRDVRTVLPNWENLSRLGAGLSVEADRVLDAGTALREIISTGQFDAIATVRRHWHDLGMRRPTQNWQTDPDWQMRLVRNDPGIHFAAETRMHERLVGADRVFRAHTTHGPHFDHFHFHFKRMEVEQRAHDVAIYDAIHAGRQPPTWTDYRAGMK